MAWLLSTVKKNMFLCILSTLIANHQKSKIRSVKVKDRFFCHEQKPACLSRPIHRGDQFFSTKK